MQKVIRAALLIALTAATTLIFQPVFAKEAIKEPSITSPEVKETQALSFADQALYKKIDQLLIIGFRGTSVTDDSSIAKILKETNLGGVILFDYDSPSKKRDRNITSPLQVQELTTELQSRAETPLFIAIDEEGGAVNRLKKADGFSFVLPRAKDLGTKKTSNTLFQSKKLARQLKVLGINLNFGPVVDLDYGTRSPIIGAFGRAFSSKPLTVVAHARAFMEGHDYYGIGTAIKHFPGHGSARGDTHEGLVDATRTYEAKELEPFQRLIADGSAHAVMVSHVLNQDIDKEYPASLSKITVTDILRKKLSFDGVVITDDLNMGAIAEKYGKGEAAVLALNAGNDLLIFSNNIDTYDDALVFTVRDAIFNAVKDKTLSEDRIDEAFHHVMYWKAWLDLLPDEKPSTLAAYY
jgi:beta-N-acetylhexosaminidase